MPRVRDSSGIPKSDGIRLPSILVAGALGQPDRFYLAADSKSTPAPSGRSLDSTRPAARSKSCEAQSCSLVSSFGYLASGSPVFCSVHASLGMVDLRHPPCRADGCPTQPTFGYPPTADGQKYQPEYCSQHRLEGMVNLSHRKALEFHQENGEVEMVDLGLDSREGHNERGSGEGDERNGDRTTSSDDVTEQLQQQKRSWNRVSQVTKMEDKPTAAEGASSLQDGMASGVGMVGNVGEVGDGNNSNSVRDNGAAAPAKRKSIGAILVESSTKAQPKAGSRSRIGTIGAVSVEAATSSNGATLASLRVDWEAAAALRNYRTCYHQPCGTTACFGFPGGKRTACAKHRLEGMVNLDRYIAKMKSRGYGDSNERPNDVSDGGVLASISRASVSSPSVSSGMKSTGNGNEIVKNNFNGGEQAVATTHAAQERRFVDGRTPRNRSCSTAGGEDQGAAVTAEAAEPLRTSRSGRPLGRMSARFRDFDYDDDDGFDDSNGDGGMRKSCVDHRVKGMVNLVSLNKGKKSAGGATGAAARSNSTVIKPQRRPSSVLIGKNGDGNFCKGEDGESSNISSGISRHRTGGARIRKRGGGGPDDELPPAIGAGARGESTAVTFAATGNKAPASRKTGIRAGDGSVATARMKNSVAVAKERASKKAKKCALSVDIHPGSARFEKRERKTVSPRSHSKKQYHGRGVMSRPPTKHSICVEEGCSTTARFGYADEKRRTFCGTHKRSGMINLNKRSKVTAAAVGHEKEGVSASAGKRTSGSGKIILPSSSSAAAATRDGSGGGAVGSLGRGKACNDGTKPNPAEEPAGVLNAHAEVAVPAAAAAAAAAATEVLNEDSETAVAVPLAAAVPAPTTVAAALPVARTPAASNNICREVTCRAHACFGFLGNRRQFCFKHRVEGMVNLIAKSKSAAASSAAPAEEGASELRVPKPLKPVRKSQQKHRNASPTSPSPAHSRGDAGSAAHAAASSLSRAPAPFLAPPRITRSPVWLGGKISHEGVSFNEGVSNGESKGKGRVASWCCRARDCDRHASFGFQGGERISCSVHKRKGMINLPNCQQSKVGGAASVESDEKKGGRIASRGKRFAVQPPDTLERRLFLKKPRKVSKARSGEGGDVGDSVGRTGGAKWQRSRCGVCGRLPKLGCSSGSCFDCCVKSGVPCEAHAKQMERKQRENELLATPDEGPSGEVARLPKEAFKEDSFHAIGETATLWCLKDFVCGKSTQAAMETLSRTKRAGRLANHRESAESAPKRRRTVSARHPSNTVGQSHGTPSGGGIGGDSGNGTRSANEGGADAKASAESCAAAAAVGVSGETGVAPCDGEDKPLDRVVGEGENAIAEVVENGQGKLTPVGRVGEDFHAAPVAVPEDTAAMVSANGQKDAVVMLSSSSSSSSSTSRVKKVKRRMSADGDMDLSALREAAVRAKWRRKHEELLRKVES